MFTVDQVHQAAYCPRRLFLMYADGRWDDNLFTEQGKSVHSRVDAEEDLLPDIVPAAESEEPPRVSRSVSLTDATLDLTGKLDLLETSGDEAVPVDTKRGKVPDVPFHAYEPERVQMMCQGLLLRANGYRAERGMLYFAGSRRRVEVFFDSALETRTLELLGKTRQVLAGDTAPPPLLDSPKCHGCSLAGICLPDELNLLNARPQSDVRRLYAARDDALPLYVQEQWGHVGISGEALEVTKNKASLGHFPLKDVSQLVLCGNIGVSAQCLHALCDRGIPVVHMSYGHWFYGITHGLGLRNAFDRAAQFAVAADRAKSLVLAKAFIRAKIQNQRTMLRRNGGSKTTAALADLKNLLGRVDACADVDSLLGVEGSAAAIYFGSFSSMVGGNIVGFDPCCRNRRPPKDPLNAMLSFTYSLLTKEMTIALITEGLDPYWGFMHRPRHGKPSLALDLMEELRPLVADSAVLTAINNKMVTAEDFTVVAAGCAMNAPARRAVIRAYEQRLDQMITHPVFDYRCSWRAVVRIQARLLSRYLRGEIPEYSGIVTR